jgi:hypothetical protein
MSPVMHELSTDVVSRVLDSDAWSQPAFGPSATVSQHQRSIIGASAAAFTYTTAVLDGPDGMLQMPMLVQIRRTETYVAVTDPATSIHGVGETLRDATQDFLGALVEYRDVLLQKDFPLNRDMAALLIYLVARLPR